MSVFNTQHYDAHEQVIFCSEPTSGLRAIIALHSTARGPALGGCRMRAYASDAEAIDDVLKLSRAMSYKHALGDRPFGGGKAVIIGDPVRHKSPELLQRFAKCVDSLAGRFIVAEDSGIDVKDMKLMSLETRHVRNLPLDPSSGPSPYTARGVFVGMLAALRHLGKKPMYECVVCVQGLGSVGMELCRLLREAGATLVVSDVLAERSESAAVRFQADIVKPDRAHSVTADIYSPCALGGVLNDRTVREIHAKLIAGAANNQLADASVSQHLAARGITYCPDYVINAGGIRATASPEEFFDHRTAMQRVDGIANAITLILERAKAEGKTTDAVADAIARKRIARNHAAECA